MSDKIEGTIVLDGLIEGRVPDDPSIRSKLEEWVELLKQHKVPVHLEMSGPSFSILPDNIAVPSRELGTDPEQTIRQALEQLIAIVPPSMRAQVFSTLRSSEYRKDTEIQALYGINADGSIEVAKRTVEAETVAPPQPPSRKELLRYVAAGVVIALVILGLSYAFPGTRQLWSQVGKTVTPTAAEDIAVDVGPFAPFIEVKEKQVIEGGQYLVLVLHRTDAYPKDDAALDVAAKAAGDSVRQRLAVEAIARGRFEIDLYVKDEGRYPSRAAEFPNWDEKGEATVAMQLPAKKRTERVVFRF